MSGQRYSQQILVLKNLPDVQTSWRPSCCAGSCPYCCTTSRNQAPLYRCCCTQSKDVHNPQQKYKTTSVFDYFYEQMYSDTKQKMPGYTQCYSSSSTNSQNVPLRNEISYSKFKPENSWNFRHEDKKFEFRSSSFPKEMIFKTEGNSSIKSEYVQYRDRDRPPSGREHVPATFAIPLGYFQVYLAHETNSAVDNSAPRNLFLEEKPTSSADGHCRVINSAKDPPRATSKSKMLTRKRHSDLVETTEAKTLFLSSMSCAARRSRCAGGGSREHTTKGTASHNMRLARFVTRDRFESRIKSTRGSRIISMSGSRTKSTSESRTKSTSGSRIKSTSGSRTKSTSGSKIKSTSGSRMQSSSRSKTPCTSRSRTQSTSRSRTPCTSRSRSQSTSRTQPTSGSRSPASHRSRSQSTPGSRSPASHRSRSQSMRGSRSKSTSRSRSRLIPCHSERSQSPVDLGAHRRRSRERTQDVDIAAGSRSTKSPSIRRRAGSPCHLDKRRITSARRRPVLYRRFASPSSSSESSSILSSDDSDSSSSWRSTFAASIKSKPRYPTEPQRPAWHSSKDARRAADSKKNSKNRRKRTWRNLIPLVPSGSPYAARLSTFHVLATEPLRY